jgi:hypothetical protein
MTHIRFYLPIAILIISCASILADDKDETTNDGDLTEQDFPDSIQDRFSKLTELDYKEVADELGVEVAVIKTVSHIETGGTHTGFYKPGLPIINFCTSIFRSRLRQAGISAGKYRHSEAFGGLNTRRYGSYEGAQYARLNAAIKINDDLAKESAYWGMFQIGGFNWRSCDVSSVDEFVDQMSESQAMQLELFARFIRNNGMLKYLQAKDWTGFARAYNGPTYLRNGYPRRLRATYAKYRNQ